MRKKRETEKKIKKKAKQTTGVLKHVMKEDRKGKERLQLIAKGTGEREIMKEYQQVRRNGCDMRNDQKKNCGILGRSFGHYGCAAVIVGTTLVCVLELLQILWNDNKTSPLSTPLADKICNDVLISDTINKESPPTYQPLVFFWPFPWGECGAVSYSRLWSTDLRQSVAVLLISVVFVPQVSGCPVLVISVVFLW